LKNKILIIFGTRPEAIKMAPVVRKMKESGEWPGLKVCVTAQHREMLDQVLEIFGIHPDYDLNVMKPNQDLYNLTSTVLLGLGEILDEYKPELVMVHGDTTTSFCAALAAYYKQIPVAHVEAGLRTGNIYAPWPEEINRKLTGAITKYHFAPTESARLNLEKEGIKENIFVTGNTVIDALQIAVNMIHSDQALQSEIIRDITGKGYPLGAGRKIILITGHRRENFGEGFINICKAIKEIAEKYPETDLVYPVHFNPNVKKPVFELLGETPNIYLTEPMDYLPFIYLMEKSFIVLTDSGGIQEEAPSLGKPVIVMRDTTERPEAVEAGTVKLVGTDTSIIIREISNLMENEDQYAAMSKAHNPYGDGNAAARIVDVLKMIFNPGP
jgi:UDP-N-acetylglucosamine 2-epimerase (non-hydrolysing)